MQAQIRIYTINKTVCNVYGLHGATLYGAKVVTASAYCLCRLYVDPLQR